jgi:hypothetical protein
MLTVSIVSGDKVEISAFFAGPAPDAVVTTSMAAATDQLSEAGTLRFLAAETTGGECRPVHEVDADTSMPLGSVFKLYVLGAVVDAVAAGGLDWSTSVVIRDELDSVRSGITQDEEPGSELSVFDLAHRMISISDDTATDHLIDLVGRNAVEDAQLAYGHTSPERNIPFMTTRELTIVKFGPDTELRLDFLGSSAAGKVTILNQLIRSKPLPSASDITAVTKPIEVESLGWFASPSDICRAVVKLTTDPVVLEILVSSPRVPDDQELWDAVAYLGGSEPGVEALVWRTETEDGRSFVVAGGVVNEDRLLDQANVIGLFGAARDRVLAES